MLSNFSRAQYVAAWLAAVTVLAAGSVVWGAAISISNGELWLAALMVPPAVMLLVWRGPPPLTVAELLHSVNDAPSERRL